MSKLSKYHFEDIFNQRNLDDTYQIISDCIPGDYILRNEFEDRVKVLCKEKTSFHFNDKGLLYPFMLPHGLIENPAEILIEFYIPYLQQASNQLGYNFSYETNLDINYKDYPNTAIVNDAVVKDSICGLVEFNIENRSDFLPNKFLDENFSGPLEIVSAMLICHIINTLNNRNILLMVDNEIRKLIYLNIEDNKIKLKQSLISELDFKNFVFCRSYF